MRLARYLNFTSAQCSTELTYVTADVYHSEHILKGLQFLQSHTELKVVLYVKTHFKALPVWVADNKQKKILQLTTE